MRGEKQCNTSKAGSPSTEMVLLCFSTLQGGILNDGGLECPGQSCFAASTKIESCTNNGHKGHLLVILENLTVVTNQLNKYTTYAT
jgi:hypothetical protein